MTHTMIIIITEMYLLEHLRNIYLYSFFEVILPTHYGPKWVPIWSPFGD